MRTIKGATLLLLISLPLFALAPSPAYAKDNLTLSPPLKEIVLGPGLVETTADISLTNNTSYPVVADVKLVDLKALGEFGGSDLSKAGLPDKYDLANWMSLPDGNKLNIGANKTAVVKVNIANRKDLAPGGHYGAAIITTTPVGTSNKDVSLNQQLVSLMFIKKTGGENYDLHLDSMTPNAWSKLPESIKLDFRNDGNVHVVPRGFVEIRDPKNNLVAKAILNPDSMYILPEKDRSLTSIFQHTSEGKHISGKYSITAYYRHDGTDKFSTVTTHFNYGSNWGKLKYILVPIVVLLAIGMYVFKRKPQLIKRIANKVRRSSK